VATRAVAAAVACLVAFALVQGADAGEAAREAFVTNQVGNSLSVVDLAGMSQVAEIKIGGKPAGVAMSPDGRTAYVTSPESKELVAVDADKREVARRVPVIPSVAPSTSRTGTTISSWFWIRPCRCRDRPPWATRHPASP
jgi:YVTN family beta-propeller protein